ncbi:MAG TPA: cupin domain-containing protein [Mycobacteriales bacterium]|nr:cupin domain-containing protein [Mycobacteriales bacterium]
MSAFEQDGQVRVPGAAHRRHEGLTGELSREAGGIAMAVDDLVTRVAPEERVPGDPTPGLTRERAFATEGMWAGFATTEPHTTTAWHHHGEHETVIYVVSGALRIECGPGGAHAVEAGPGDFVRVPQGAIHREINPADVGNDLVVIRVGHGVPTVNVDDAAPG